MKVKTWFQQLLIKFVISIRKPHWLKFVRIFLLISKWNQLENNRFGKIIILCDFCYLFGFWLLKHNLYLQLTRIPLPYLFHSYMYVYNIKFFFFLICEYFIHLAKSIKIVQGDITSKYTMTVIFHEEIINFLATK